MLEANSGKKVYVLIDNAKFHTSKEIQDFADAHSEELFLINTPRYSPVLNPQENIWNKLKNCIFSLSAFTSIDELFYSVSSIYDSFNEDTNMVKSLAYARNYYE